LFYCLWDDRASSQGKATLALTAGQRLAPVWLGQRNSGQRSLEIEVDGAADVAAAEAALRQALPEILVVKK
jgi:hypothetical protein